MPHHTSLDARAAWIDREVAGFFSFVAAHPGLAHDPYGSPAIARNLLDNPQHVPADLPPAAFARDLGGLALVAALDWSQGFPIPQSVDAVAFSVDERGQLCIALIRRRDNGQLALPGGYVDPPFLAPAGRPADTNATAAAREAKEEVGLDLPIGPRDSTTHRFAGIDHLDSYGHRPVDGVIRKRTSSEYFGMLLPQVDGNVPQLTPGDDAASAGWARVRDVVQGISDGSLALHVDHNAIVALSLQQLRLRCDRIAHETPARLWEPQLACALRELRTLAPAIEPLVAAAQDPKDGRLSPPSTTGRPRGRGPSTGMRL